MVSHYHATNGSDITAPHVVLDHTSRTDDGNVHPVVGLNIRRMIAINGARQEGAPIAGLCIVGMDAFVRIADTELTPTSAVLFWRRIRR